MKRIVKSIGLALCIGAVTVGTANAAVIHPGSTIITKNGPDGELTGGCTVAVAGHNKAGEVIFITAGHCTENAGDTMHLVTDKGLVEVGKTQLTTGTPLHDDGHINWDGDDYAFIKANAVDSNGEPIVASAKSETTTQISAFVQHPNIPGGVVSEHSDVKPYTGQLVWVDGSSTGHKPGVVISDHDNYFRVITPTVPGDSGGIVYDMKTGNAMGINSRDEIIGESGTVLFSPRESAQSIPDAIDKYEDSTGDTFTYATETPEDTSTIRHPLGPVVDQTVDELKGTIDDAVASIIDSRLQ